MDSYPQHKINESIDYQIRLDEEETRQEKWKKNRIFLRLLTVAFVIATILMWTLGYRATVIDYHNHNQTVCRVDSFNTFIGTCSKTECHRVGRTEKCRDVDYSCEQGNITFNYTVPITQQNLADNQQISTWLDSWTRPNQTFTCYWDMATKKIDLGFFPNNVEWNIIGYLIGGILFSIVTFILCLDTIYRQVKSLPIKVPMQSDAYVALLLAMHPNDYLNPRSTSYLLRFRMDPLYDTHILAKIFDLVDGGERIPHRVDQPTSLS